MTSRGGGARHLVMPARDAGIFFGRPTPPSRHPGDKPGSRFARPQRDAGLRRHDAHMERRRAPHPSPLVTPGPDPGVLFPASTANSYILTLFLDCAINTPRRPNGVLLATVSFGWGGGQACGFTGNVPENSRGQAAGPGGITTSAPRGSEACSQGTCVASAQPSCEEVLPDCGRCSAPFRWSFTGSAHRAGQRPRLPFLSRGTNATPTKDHACLVAPHPLPKTKTPGFLRAFQYLKGKRPQAASTFSAAT